MTPGADCGLCRCLSWKTVSPPQESFEGKRSTPLVSPFYDSLLAKVIVSGEDRDDALARSRRALSEFLVAGVPTTFPFHSWLLEQPDFVDSGLHTTWVHPALERNE